MPQCICGRFYTQTNYDSEGVEVCPKCSSQSVGQSYMNSKEWVGESKSGYSAYIPADES